MNLTDLLNQIQKIVHLDHRIPKILHLGLLSPKNLHLRQSDAKSFAFDSGARVWVWLGPCIPTVTLAITSWPRVRNADLTNKI